MSLPKASLAAALGMLWGESGDPEQFAEVLAHVLGDEMAGQFATRVYQRVGTLILVELDDTEVFEELQRRKLTYTGRRAEFLSRFRCALNYLMQPAGTDLQTAVRDDFIDELANAGLLKKVK